MENPPHHSSADSRETTTPYWLLHPSGGSPSLPLPSQTDVLVVGGGIAGASTAYWLSQKRIRCALLDERPLASGASGRSVGLLRIGVAEFYNRIVHSIGPEEASWIWSFTRENHRILRETISRERILCDLENAGGVHLALTPLEFLEAQESVELMNKAGFPDTSIPEKDLGKFLGPHIRGRFFGGRHSPEDALVDPAGLVRGLAERAKASGSQIFEEVSVKGLEELPDGDIWVKTSQGNVRARYVVLAASARIGQLVHRWQEVIRPVRTQMLATDPVGPLFRHAHSTNYGRESWRQAPRGHVLVGGFRWMRRDRDEGTFSEEVTPEIQRALENFLTKRLGLPAPLEVAAHWAATIGVSKDFLPLVGPLPGRPRLLVSGAYAGDSFSFAFLAAKALSELIDQGRTEIPVRLFSPSRFEE